MIHESVFYRRYLHDALAGGGFYSSDRGASAVALRQTIV